jgi:hypothetical protein
MRRVGGWVPGFRLGGESSQPALQPVLAHASGHRQGCTALNPQKAYPVGNVSLDMIVARMASAAATEEDTVLALAEEPRLTPGEAGPPLPDPMTPDGRDSRLPAPLPPVDPPLGPPPPPCSGPSLPCPLPPPLPAPAGPAALPPGMAAGLAPGGLVLAGWLSPALRFSSGARHTTASR